MALLVLLYLSLALPLAWLYVLHLRVLRPLVARPSRGDGDA